MCFRGTRVILRSRRDVILSLSELKRWKMCINVFTSLVSLCLSPLLIWPHLTIFPLKRVNTRLSSEGTWGCRQGLLMRLTDVSAVLAEGHMRNTQGSNVTTLLSVGFRGCFAFISSEILRFKGMKSNLRRTMPVYNREMKTSCRRGWNEAALWLAERTRKSARPWRHLTLTLRFPNCWQQQHGSQTWTSKCHSNHVARPFLPHPPGGGERRGERFGSGRGHHRLLGGRLRLPRLVLAQAERTAVRQTLRVGYLYPDAAIHRYIQCPEPTWHKICALVTDIKRAFNGINAKSDADSLKGAGKSIQEVRTQELLPCWNVSHSSIKDWDFLVRLKTVHIIFPIRSDQSGVVWKRVCFNARRCFLTVIKNFPVCLIDRRAVQSRFCVSSRALCRFCYKFKKCYLTYIFIYIFCT